MFVVNISNKIIKLINNKIIIRVFSIASIK